MPVRTPVVVAVACAAALLLAAPATAATPFTIGQGLHPAVAVGADGAGHFAWSDAAAGNPLHYCKVAKGASTCSISKTLNPPLGATSDGNHVFVNGSTVQIVSGRCCDNLVVLYTSTDGGANFSGPTEIGSINIAAGLGQGPGATFSGYYFNPFNAFQNMPAAGPKQTAAANLPPGFSNESAGVAVHQGTTPVVAQGGPSNLTVWRYGGAGDLNDATNWVGPTAVTPAANEIHLAAGGTGPAILVGKQAGGKLVAMRFDGTTFTSLTTLESADAAFPALGADSTGRATALWRHADKLRFSQTQNGTSWSAPVDLLSGGSEPGLAFTPRVATGADGHGYAMWTRPVGGLDPANIRVMQLSPGGASSGGGEKTTTVDTGDQVITFFTPKQCRPPSAKVRVHVTSKIKQKLAKGQGRSKILFVDFLLDKTRTFRDMKAAFRTKIDISKAKPGSTHTLTAQISLKQLTGAKRPFSKTLKATLKVC